MLVNVYCNLTIHPSIHPNGTTARGGPRPPSRVSSILPGSGRLPSSFCTLALLHLPSLHLPSATWVSLWGAFLLAHWGGLPWINHPWRMTCPAHFIVTLLVYIYIYIYVFYFILCYVHNFTSHNSFSWPFCWIVAVVLTEDGPLRVWNMSECYSVNEGCNKKCVR